jgi:hypothetical protein
MNNQKEIQIAWEIWNLVNKLNDLLWDRYEECFLEIYLKKEEQKFLLTLEDPSLPEGKEKKNPSP